MIHTFTWKEALYNMLVGEANGWKPFYTNKNGGIEINLGLKGILGTLFGTLFIKTILNCGCDLILTPFRELILLAKYKNTPLILFCNTNVRHTSKEKT
jgi:hypothetical protein